MRDHHVTRYLAGVLLEDGYDPGAKTYFSALGRALTARFDPKDAV